MKITMTIEHFVVEHEFIEEDDKDTLISHAISIGPVSISEGECTKFITSEEMLYDLGDKLQKGAHNFIKKELKGE